MDVFLREVQKWLIDFLCQHLLARCEPSTSESI